MRTENSKTPTTNGVKARTAGAVLMAITAASILAVGSIAPFRDAHADDGNGLLIPMYGWDAGFEEVMEAKSENQDTEMIVVINPSNGPGGSKESHWSEVVEDLQDEDIQVVGYVSTAYSGRSEGEVKEEIERYAEWYGVDGIFFDEVSPSAQGYYEELYDHVKDESDLVVLNPGAAVPKSYEEAADIIIVYENYGIPSSVSSNGMSESMLGALPYGVDPSESEFKELSEQVGYLYVSPDWISVAPTIEDQIDWAD
jgi:hypothetical protein